MASNDDTSWHIRAEIALLATLRAGQPITYEGLATAAEIPAPHRIHKLTLWLEASMAEDVAARRPLRAAIVSRADMTGQQRAFSIWPFRLA